MRILGVDPGSIVTGYGVIDAHRQRVNYVASGTVRMHSKEALSLRLRSIYDALLQTIDTYHPDAFCLETAFYNKNVQSTLKLGHVRGVALLAAVHRQLAITEYSPREIKRAVTGTGAAAKQQVEFMVKTLLGKDLVFRNSDEADGLAIALCHAFQSRTSSVGGNSWKEFVLTNPERVRG